MHMNMTKKIFIALAAILLPLTAACNSNDSSSVRSVEDVPGHSIGVVAGSAASALTAELGDVRLYVSETAMAGDVRSGILDCAVVESYNTSSAMFGTRGIKTLSEPLFTLDLAIIAAKQSRDLTSNVNSALRTLTENGVLASIVDNYTHGKAYIYEPRTDISDSAPSLRLAVGGEFSEFLRVDEHGNYFGLDIDVARAVCDVLGVRLELMVFEPNGVVNAVWVGKADFGIGGMYETPERAELVDFSNSYFTCELEVIVRR